MTSQGKQHLLIFGLVGVAAVAVLYMLYKEGQAGAGSVTATGETVPEPNAQGPTYPNSQPIQLGNITINDTPPNQSYNVSDSQIPTVGIGNTDGCGCEDNDCEQVGTVQTTQAIPEHILKTSMENIVSFQAKGKPVSNVEAGFAAAPAKAAPVTANGAGQKVGFAA